MSLFTHLDHLTSDNDGVVLWTISSFSFRTHIPLPFPTVLRLGMRSIIHHDVPPISFLDKLDNQVSKRSGQVSRKLGYPTPREREVMTKI
jgi:hypothetical protein